MSRVVSFLVAVAVCCVGLASAEPAAGLAITVVYDESAGGAVDPCASDPPLQACAGGVDQTPRAVEIVEAAAERWMDIIEDAHAMTILVSWQDPAVSEKPGASVVATDGLGRVTIGRVWLVPTFGLFYDPTPDDDEEFLGIRGLQVDDEGQVTGSPPDRLQSGMMRPKLYRTLPSVERQEAFLNTGTEVLEVGYNGLQRTPPGQDALPFPVDDLLTEALHEVGHLVGMVNPLLQCQSDVIPSGYLPMPELTGGKQLGVKAYEYTHVDSETMQEVQKLDCAHLAAGGITACKETAKQNPASNEDSTEPGLTVHECTAHQALFWQGLYSRSARQRPSVTDILAAAAAEGWTNVDLPRKYSLGTGGAWGSPETWYGNRAPDAGDDAYVVNQDSPGTFTAVTSKKDGAARNLFLSDGNRVVVQGSRLALSRAVWLAGPDSLEGPVRPIGDDPPESEPPITAPAPRSTLEVRAGGLVLADRLGIERTARLRLRNGGSAQFGDVLNAGSVEGRGTLGVTRSFANGMTEPDRTSGVIRAEGGPLRIVTPPADPGDITTDPPVVDLDGAFPLWSPTPPRIWALDGSVEIDAIVDEGTLADIRVGPGRALRLVRNGLLQFSSPDPRFGLRLQGGLVGATLDAPPSTFLGRVEVDGIGRFTGRTTFDGGADVRLDLGGTVAGINYDQLEIQDTAELGGTLRVSLSGGFSPEVADEFAVMTFKQRIGEFDQHVLPSLPSSQTWQVQYGAGDLRLVVTVDPDINDDGTVDVLDLLDIIHHFGPCPPGPDDCPWDLTGDGIIDNNDLVAWQKAKP